MQQCKTKLIWKKKKLKEICNSITTGKLDANAMTENGEYRFYTCAKDFYKIDSYAFAGESLLISGNGANVGYIHYYNGKFNAYQRTYILQNFNKNIFYIKCFLDNYLKDRISKEVNAGNIPFIKLDTLSEMIIIYPEDKQQQAHIANILSTCDDVIDKTEQTIEKYKQIKDGMMQDLFTRGIDENGKLRPKYEDAPDLYKYSPELDRYIPKDWKVKKLDECCIKPCSYGINAPAVDFDINLPLYLRITDITESGKFCKENRKCVNDKEASKYKLFENDIVFARTGATVGKTYLYNKNDGYLIYAGFLICFSLNPCEILPYLLKTYTETDFYKNWVSIYSQRSGQPGINGNEYSNMLLLKPLMYEQGQMTKSFQAIDSKIDFEKESLSKYKQIKQGLMKRLLTPPADAEIVEE